MLSLGISVRVGLTALTLFLNPLPVTGVTSANHVGPVHRRHWASSLIEMNTNNRRGKRKLRKRKLLPKAKPSPSSAEEPTGVSLARADSNSSPGPIVSASPPASSAPSSNPIATPPCERKEPETSNQTVKISPQGVEVSGFPLWLNIAILIVAPTIFIVSALRVKKAIAEGSIGVGKMVAIGVAVVVVLVFLGRVWDRWSTASDSHLRIERAKEETRREILPSVPVAPSSLGGTPASSSQVNVNWADNSNNESGFKLERKLGSEGSFTQFVALAANATSYVDTGLSPETTVTYRIKAFNATGDSTYSNESAVTTLATVKPNSDSWSNPLAVFQYIILPLLLLLTILVYPFVFFYIRDRMLRGRRYP